MLTRLLVVDSHTGGEPTRTVVGGGPDLGPGPMADRARRFATEHDRVRSAVACEPRGSEVMVGALLTDPHDPSCDVGVIFFTTVGLLGMCGHGTMGVVETLAHLGRIGDGPVRIDTPVGTVEAHRHADGTVSLANVPAFRHAQNVTVDVPGYGQVTGDVAWGGNWFFLVDGAPCPVDLFHADRLTSFTKAVRDALAAQGVTGAGGAEIDHVEVFAPTPTASRRSFVLCPGGTYDRSPCGTGTSAKLACLAADGRLAEGEPWVQESVVGSRFTASYRRLDAERIVPTIAGRAFVTAESTLLVHPDDPLGWGFR